MDGGAHASSGASRELLQSIAARLDAKLQKHAKGSWAKLFFAVDHDGSERAEFHEFKALLRNKTTDTIMPGLELGKKVVSDPELRMLWTSADADRSEEISDEELHLLWKSADEDGSGKVTAEFKDFFNKLMDHHANAVEALELRLEGERAAFAAKQLADEAAKQAAIAAKDGELDAARRRAGGQDAVGGAMGLKTEPALRVRFELDAARWSLSSPTNRFEQRSRERPVTPRSRDGGDGERDRAIPNIEAGTRTWRGRQAAQCGMKTDSAGVLDLATGAWTELAPVPSAPAARWPSRHFPASGATKVFVVGGSVAEMHEIRDERGSVVRELGEQPFSRTVLIYDVGDDAAASASAVFGALGARALVQLGGDREYYEHERHYPAPHELRRGQRRLPSEPNAPERPGPRPPWDPEGRRHRAPAAKRRGGDRRADSDCLAELGVAAAGVATVAARSLARGWALRSGRPGDRLAEHRALRAERLREDEERLREDTALLPGVPAGRLADAQGHLRREVVKRECNHDPVD
ncbi:hypothetical protein SO694_00008259 [Aureococcus anophagefferens]|uniref:EF-hand domain-containing protein n=1 Tax=Aureococcus anophagefferens TaxID=44056 RepID=A0ABR1GE06_AURAN